LQSDYYAGWQLAIENEMLQLVGIHFEIVDSGATTHITPDYIANAAVAPIRPVPVINLDDFLFDDEEDEPTELPPDGPTAWIDPATPLSPNVPVLDLDVFLF